MSSIKMLKIVVLVISFLSLAQCKELPKYLQNLKCSWTTDFEACFMKNGNIAIPLVAKGDPEYNIPTLDPFELPFFGLITSPSLSLNITNLKVYGLQNTRIVDLKINAPRGIFTLILKNENVTLNGQYSVDGKILVMPLKGDGPLTVTIRNGTFKVTNTAIIVTKDGDKYHKPVDSRIEYNLEKIDFKFDNLFQGNKQLGDQVNRFLNENWDLLTVDFGPGIADTVSQIVRKLYDEFASAIPLKKFYTDFVN